MTLYMIVSADRLELPLFVADKTAEAADYLGTTKERVFQAIYRNQIVQKKYKVKRIEA